MLPKKSLGQNFLISPAPIRVMVKETGLISTDTVLEIGPGRGILTRALLDTGAQVIAIEKDDELIPVLQETFIQEISSGQLTLVHADVMNIDLANLNLQNHKYKLIANIPYYITGEIIRRFLESEIQPSCIAILVQKEVAERIAKDPKESILSISVKTYGKPKYAGTVKRGLFRPMPNVDSAVLIVNNISKNFFTTFNEEKFFKIIKSGFAHKRKKLIRNLEENIPKEKLEKIFAKLNLDINSRAETISLEIWRKITELV